MLHGSLVHEVLEYFWTETGGTIHKTERELSLDRRHGWVKHNGKKWR